MGSNNFNANLFLSAQEFFYDSALKEIQNGRKQSHWIWFIFPQLKGLGHSSVSDMYGIKDIEEARAYMKNETLRSRLVEISEALLAQDGDIKYIMGYPDNLKVCSCMTLFREATPEIDVFQKVLDKFYGGEPDKRSLDILKGKGRNIGAKPDRNEMARVFADTMNMINESNSLKEIVNNSIANTTLYKPQTPMPLPKNPGYKPEIYASIKRTFESAKALTEKFPNEKIAVLNFASATNPGGGAVSGARAQEESLCRCSTLYPCLNTPSLRRDYYDYHRANYNFRYTDSCIYIPDVAVIKTDTNIPQRMPSEDWFTVDVITCAAPNLRRSDKFVSTDEQYNLHIRRAKRILSSAAIGGATVLVLGAFGCGAFRNDPKTVAKAYKDVLKEFEGYFKCIEFAVFSADTESANYSAFASEFSN